MKSIAKFLILVVFVLLMLAGFIFTIHNTTPVPLWLGTEFSASPVSIWVLLAFITGGLLGLLLGLGLLRSFNSHRELTKLRNLLARTQRELAEARSQAATMDKGNGS